MFCHFFGHAYYEVNGKSRKYLQNKAPTKRMVKDVFMLSSWCFRSNRWFEGNFLDYLYPSTTIIGHLFNILYTFLTMQRSYKTKHLNPKDNFTMWHCSTLLWLEGQTHLSLRPRFYFFKKIIWILLFCWCLWKWT